MSIDVSNFEAEVIQKSHEVPVVVDFWAPWCGPCKMLGPVLDKMAEQAAGRWVLAKVNIDEHQDLAAQYGVRSIPHVMLFSNGEVRDAFLGMLPEPEIRKWLEKSIPSPHSGEVEKARETLAASNYAEAAGMLESVLKAEPGNETARLLLAEALLHHEPAKVAELLQPFGPDAECWDKVSALKSLAALVVKAENADQLPAGKGRARFIEGALKIKECDFAAAMEAFIDVLETDRNYGDGAARDAGKAVFQFLGIRHPVAEQYYRRFSSALHV